jgi:hypothetical protein
MAFIKLQFKPGMNRDQTNYSNEGSWWDGNHIRFRSGYPQKIGGWVKAAAAQFYGVCRQFWNWVTTYADNLIALGTNNKLYLAAGGEFYDITPLRAVNPTLSSTITDNCVQTVAGLTTVTLNLGLSTDPQCVVGSFVTVRGVTGTVGGIPNSEINANHILTAVGATSISFEVTTPAATSVAAGGGTAIFIDFEIAPGNVISSRGYGWGVGFWGRGAWGSGASAPLFTLQRDWFFDNIDNDLVMNIRSGVPYYWARGAAVNPATALSTRAITLEAYATSAGFSAAAVPVRVTQILVSQQDRHVIAFGAVPFGSTNPDDFDPLLIRWCSQGSPGDWTPTVTNSAGFIRVSRGSGIIKALPTRQEILVFTDTHLYTLQFLGTTDVFSLQEYADNISLISPRAVSSAANITYWMGNGKFYAYTGRVETLACSLRNHVFENLNTDQAGQIVCGTNEQWNEIWWFYPSADSNWNNKYVVYNHLERIWYYGDIERTAWMDSALQSSPLAAATSEGAAKGYMYSHEQGVDADGAPLDAFILSNDFDIGDGDSFMLSSRLIPDVDFNGSTEGSAPAATVTIYPRNFPGQSYNSNMTQNGPVIGNSTNVDEFTSQVFMRTRARQMAFKIQSENLGTQWQLGAPRLDVKQDGRR